MFCARYSALNVSTYPPRDPTWVHSFFHSKIAPFINSLHERLEHANFTLV